ncbi:hypothetical protein BDD12DRAFT_820820 [Trichophaea hybrida]|nr:hypothetical protein BDD12DRAFT_820820 [Trichophaea hybrida]
MNTIMFDGNVATRLATPQPLLLPHHLHRHQPTPPKHHKRRLLPPERIYHNTLEKQPTQLRIRKEIKRLRRGACLQRRREPHPKPHDALRRPCQRVRKKHQQQPRVHANMEMSHGPDGVYVCAIIGANVNVCWREGLEVPVWWWEIKGVGGEERE